MRLIRYTIALNLSSTALQYHPDKLCLRHSAFPLRVSSCDSMAPPISFARRYSNQQRGSCFRHQLQATEVPATAHFPQPQPGNDSMERRGAPLGPYRATKLVRTWRRGTRNRGFPRDPGCIKDLSFLRGFRATRFVSQGSGIPSEPRHLDFCERC